MKFISIAFFLLTTAVAAANEDLEHINYTWEENPRLTDMDINDTNIAVFNLKNFMSKEYLLEDNGFYEYVLVHKKVKLLSDVGIEAYNKVYLPVPDEDLILIEKARVINSSGKIIELQEEDIREGYNEENDSKYRYFAFEGIDKHSEVEYIYLYKKSPSHSGSLYNIQSEFPQRNVGFELICPSFLEFAFKSYNGLEEVQHDTGLYEKDKNRWFLEFENVERLPDQTSSAHEAELQYIAYKLAKNKETGRRDLFSYGELSKIMFERFYESNAKSDEKLYKKLTKKMELKDKSEEDQIREVENYIKSRVTVIDASIPDGMDLTTLWENKILTEDGVLKIMVNILKELGIKAEIGITSNRFDFKFDGEFENWAFAKDFILYFPGIEAYTSLSKYTRLGKPELANFHNDGLFIRTVTLGENEFGVGEVKFIPHNDYRRDADSLTIEVKPFNGDFTAARINVRHSLSGYKASYIQPVIEDIEDIETKQEIKEELVSFIDEDAETENVETFNTGAHLYGIKPLIITGDITSTSLLESVRENQIFKVGKLIGPQMEMYDPEERVLPVEEAFARKYHRVIKFTVPEGYRPENLDKLEIDETYVNDKGDTVMAFISDYTIEDDLVKVIITEYYKEVYYPVELYEDYRRVINAAADFNKVAVLFKKL